MGHGLETILLILEILEIEVSNILYNPGNIGKHIFSIQFYPGNSGLYDPYISSILEKSDRTIHIFSYMLSYIWIVRSIFASMLMSRGVAGGRQGVAGRSRGGRRTATAAATSQQLSHLARALDHHAQGPNIPFGVNPSLRHGTLKYCMYLI